jgi:competence protein ComEC
VGRGAARFGLVVIGLLRTPLRWLGSVPVLLGIALALTARQPDILIASDGQSVAVRRGGGALSFMQTKKDAFAVKAWLAADADGRAADDPTLTLGARCDDAGCAVQMPDGRYVTIAQRADAFADDCEKAALIVTARQPPPTCKAKIIDQARLQQSGSLALYSRNGAFAAEAVRPLGTNRPWARNALTADDAGETIEARPSSPRPVDATPSVENLSAEDQ